MISLGAGEKEAAGRRGQPSDVPSPLPVYQQPADRSDHRAGRWEEGRGEERVGESTTSALIRESEPGLDVTRSY